MKPSHPVGKVLSNQSEKSIVILRKSLKNLQKINQGLEEKATVNMSSSITRSEKNNDKS